MNKKTHNCSQNTSVMFRPKLGQEYTGTFLNSEKKRLPFIPQNIEGIFEFETVFA